MPDVGGFGVLDFVRTQDQLRRLPILIVTSRRDEESRTRALAAGAAALIGKPFEAAQILERARELLVA